MCSPPAAELMDLRQAESFLNGLPRFTDDTGKAYKPGFERIERLLAAMERPQDSLRVIHVAGTNGKGSTASILAAIGTAAGYRIGLHTSPHLFHINERMRIDGASVSDEWLAEAVERYRDLAEDVQPSFFEFTVALSLRYFADEAVELAVVEVGMGGRLDATNILSPLLSIITGIGLDHTEFLGPTIEAIAGEKAGIIKEGVPVVTSARPPARQVIEQVAAQRHAPFHDVSDEVLVVDAEAGLAGCRFTARTPVRTYHDLWLGLAGLHQLANGALAMRAAELAYDRVRRDETPVFAGMRNVQELSGLRGRLEVLRREPLVVADVSHNAEGIGAALDHIQRLRHPDGRLHVLLGLMRDKDIDAVGRLLASAGAVVRPIEVASSRAVPAAELASRLRGWDIITGPPCTATSGVSAFILEADPSDALLICGSHLVIAQLKGQI